MNQLPTGHPPTGARLPAQWQAEAAARAAAADAAYLHHIENAWRRPAQTGAQATIPTIQSCRLVQDSARADSELVMIGRDGDWELWQDSHGTTIRKRRK